MSDIVKARKGTIFLTDDPTLVERFCQIAAMEEGAAKAENLREFSTDLEVWRHTVGLPMTDARSSNERSH